MLRRHEEHRPVKFESKVIDRQFHAVVAQLGKDPGPTPDLTTGAFA